MSHFTVAVIHHPTQDVDDLLAPFDENPSAFSHFVDKTDELKEEYETSVMPRYRKPDGSLIQLSRFDWPKYSFLITKEQFESPDFDLGEHQWNTRNINGEIYYEIFVPEKFGLTYVEIPVKEQMSFEEYAVEYCGYYEHEKVEGRYGYYENPNAKWDWYQIGGRWNGMLKLKGDAIGVKGEDGVMGSHYDESGWSEARIGDIDFSPDLDEYARAKRFWEVVIEKAPLEEDEDESDFRHLWKETYYTDMYDGKEDYAKSCASFSTFAVLTPDGEWHEPGTMGWFGCDDASADEKKEWRRNYMKFFEEADPDDILTIVDCHI